jgi:hypothetical protein
MKSLFFFETIEEMFKDWQKVEDLVIYADSLNLVYHIYIKYR